MPDLKPCPFCGGQHLIPARSLDGEIHGILCMTCKVQVKFNITMGKKETFGENAEKWSTAWNKRA